MNARTPKTLYDKIWDSHLVHEAPGEASVIYIDRHLVHEVTSAQAFEGLRETGRKARRPELALAVADHNVPTEGQALGVGAEVHDDPHPGAGDQEPALGADHGLRGVALHV